MKNLNTRENCGSSGSNPSAIANTLVKNANATSWKPMMTVMHATVSVPTSNTTAPKRNVANESAAADAAPATDNTSPGTRNSHRGENSSMKRRCRQPSRHGLRCGGRERPSGCSVTGTSAMRSALSVDLMTISDANSMPVVCSSIFSNAAFVKPRRPQWKSCAGHLKNNRPIKDSTGLPSQRFFHGIAPGEIVPPPIGNRQPMTSSKPS